MHTHTSHDNQKYLQALTWSILFPDESHFLPSTSCFPGEITDSENLPAIKLGERKQSKECFRKKRM
jgi:hypothetical protein